MSGMLLSHSHPSRTRPSCGQDPCTSPSRCSGVWSPLLKSIDWSWYLLQHSHVLVVVQLLSPCLEHQVPPERQACLFVRELRLGVKFLDKLDYTLSKSQLLLYVQLYHECVPVNGDLFCCQAGARRNGHPAGSLLVCPVLPHTSNILFVRGCLRSAPAQRATLSSASHL
eukprot:1207492-Amphidinium_carterae.2